MSTTSCAEGDKGNSAGTILRETREALGLSLDDAARVTRIGKGHLSALEEGSYERLPSAVYVKGFLRLYAAYLKLPENEILRAYEKDLSDRDATSPDSREPLHVTRDKNKDNSARRFKWSHLLSVILILVAALVLSYLFLSSPTKKSGSKEYFAVSSSTTRPAVVVMPPGNTVNTSADTQHEEQPEDEKEAGNSEASSVPSGPSKGMVLKLKVVEDCWVDITIDDTVTQHYELKAGDLIEWKGEKSFSLDVGNAGGVEAELDGKSLKPFGKSGESAHIMLKSGRSEE